MVFPTLSGTIESTKNEKRIVFGRARSNTLKRLGEGIMEVFHWLVLIGIGFLSFVPPIRLHQYKQYEKYRMLRYFVTAIFVWTLVTFFIHLSENILVIYHVSLLVYPLVFLIVCLGHETIQKFVGRTTPVWMKALAVMFFFVNLGFSMTNEHHLLVMAKQRSALADKEAIFSAPFGPFFLVHTALSYVIIVTVIIKLFLHLWKRFDSDLMRLPYALILFITVFGLTLNVVHVFFHTFYIDITYLFIAVFGYYIYWLVFNRDFRFRLLATGHEVLVNAMREMYVIIDNQGGIIEYSQNFFQRLGIPARKCKDMEALMDHLHRNAVIFTDFDHVKDEHRQDKPYLYRTDQNFTLPGFNQRGTLVLFDDETSTVRLLEKLNYAVRHDRMTRLHNRSSFETDREAYEKNLPDCGVLLTDLNGLKLYNDTLGHERGDRLIETYADMLRTYAEAGATIYRFGGDEFLVFFEKTDEETLQSIEAALQEKAAKTEFPLRVSVSSGYAIRRENESLDSLLQRADRRLYAMKKSASAEFTEAFKVWMENRERESESENH